jgi:hypothetical protein
MGARRAWRRVARLTGTRTVVVPCDRRNAIRPRVRPERVSIRTVPRHVAGQVTLTATVVPRAVTIAGTASAKRRGAAGRGAGAGGGPATGGLAGGAGAAGGPAGGGVTTPPTARRRILLTRGDAGRRDLDGERRDVDRAVGVVTCRRTM